MTQTMTLYSELQNRGLIKQITEPDLENALKQSELTLYCGFDPTSDSLHVGSLLPLLLLRRFQLAGHRVIAVVGGATGMIGDPSGKGSERTLLSEEALEHNVEGIRRTIGRFLDLKGPNAAQVVNNADWFRPFSYIEFLRDVGKHFTVNYMVQKESVRARLEDREHGISYTEFSYMLLQAYDFYHLFKTKACTLQVGGSDQWGNITAGCELIRRMHAAHGGSADAVPQVYGLTSPLVMKSDGTKFGKSESGNVWLDADKTSPYQFYQYFVRVADSDVIMLLKYLSFLSIEEIRRLEESVRTAPEKREAQKTLARHLTELVHGHAEVERAEKAAEALFGAEIRSLDAKTLLEIFADAPSAEVPKTSLSGPGMKLVDLLIQTGLCASKGAARKDIQGGGIYMNNERIQDPEFSCTISALIANDYLVLRKGKKNYALIRTT